MTILQHSIAQAAAASSSYQIARSLRFNSADSAYLSRTPASAGNRTTWTWSGWVKRSTLGTSQYIFSNTDASGLNGFELLINASNQIRADDYSTANVWALNATTQVFRDTSAHFHLVLAYDTTQATAANRVKIYINGVQVTSFTSASYPTQNYNGYINNTNLHAIGRAGSSASAYLNGLLSDVRFIDGQALDPTSFGEYDANTGVWSPIAYTGTYGTNGFWLKFDDNSNNTAATLGKDSSGNSNNWTPNNFSVTAGINNDSLTDTPTNYGTDTGVGGEVRGNYPTWNPLLGSASPLNPTLSDGNLFCNTLTTEHAHTNMATPTTGKWYWEFTLGSSVLGQGVGIALTTSRLRDTTSYYYGAKSTGTVGTLYVNGGAGTTYGANYAANDVIGVALNLDAGTLTFYKNGTSQGVAVTGVSGSYDAVAAGGGGQAITAYINFGQRPFAYAAPSGFKALCTQNLPTPAIGATSSTLASKNFDVNIWTGTGTTAQNITNSGAFQPDLVWIKGRSGAYWHELFDPIRGVNKPLFSNVTNAEANYTSMTAFLSNGFTVQDNGTTNQGTNAPGATFVGWQWKGGNGTVSNTSGSITSTVSANTAAGISVVSWTSNAAGAIETMGHGLGATPAFVIIKNRDYADWWLVYHKSFSNTVRNYLQLNTTGAVATASADYWGHTSTLLGVRQSAMATVSGQRCIAYCFAEVAGFSRFGSYAGNGNADGPFVYCGFRPRFILIKGYAVAGAYWIIIDTTRDTYNVAVNKLGANVADAENSVNLGNTTQNIVDVLSNGFKLRSITGDTNNGSQSYVFAAFAEHPFQYARAR